MEAEVDRPHPWAPNPGKWAWPGTPVLVETMVIPSISCSISVLYKNWDGGTIFSHPLISWCFAPGMRSGLRTQVPPSSHLNLFRWRMRKMELVKLSPRWGVQSEENLNRKKWQGQRWHLGWETGGGPAREVVGLKKIQPGNPLPVPSKSPYTLPLVSPNF